MSFDLFTIGWLALGGALVLLELVVPGLVVVFFGLGALVVGLASGLGLVGSWSGALLLWGVSSTGLVLGARGGLKRLAAGGSERGSTDEDVDAYGADVEVLEAVAPDVVGRIRFRGSTWPARTVEERLDAGARARIVARDNLVWIVEKE